MRLAKYRMEDYTMLKLSPESRAKCKKLSVAIWELSKEAEHLEEEAAKKRALAAALEEEMQRLLEN